MPMTLAEIEKEALKLKELYERYVFTPKAIRLLRFVVDLLPGIDGRLYFMQVKHYEGENKFLCDPKSIRRIKLKKGLSENEAECAGVFCKAVDDIPALLELAHNLIASGSLCKQWNRAGMFLFPYKVIKDYDYDMTQYE